MGTVARQLGGFFPCWALSFSRKALGISVILDLFHLATGQPVWSIAALGVVGASALSGVVAILAGTSAWIAAPRYSFEKRLGRWYAAINIAATALAAASWLSRLPSPGQPGAGVLVLSFAGLAAAGIALWLVAEITEHHAARAEAPVPIRMAEDREPQRRAA